MMLIDPDQWERVGGTDVEVYALDDEVCRLIIDETVGRADAYVLFGNYYERTTDEYIKTVFPVESLEEVLIDPQRRLRNWYLVRKNDADALLKYLSDDVSRIANLSGTIVLQFSTFNNENKASAWRVTMVDKVRHRQTGEMHKHDDSKKLYLAIRRRIRKASTYSSIFIFRDGSTVEDRTRVLFTEAAANAAKAGEIAFTATPGRRIAIE